MSAFFGNAAPRQVATEEERAVDLAAEAVGFVNREPLKAPPKRRRGTAEQLHNFTMRLAIGDAEKFIRYCERERLSYREAFAKLVADLDRR